MNCIVRYDYKIVNFICIGYTQLLFIQAKFKTSSTIKVCLNILSVYPYL